MGFINKSVMKKKILTVVIFVCADLAVVFISFWIAYSIRDRILPYLFNDFFKVSLLPWSIFLDHFYFSVAWIIVFAYEKLYTKRYAFWDEVKVLLKSITVSYFLIMIMIFISKKQILFSRTVVALAWLVSLFLFPLSRFLIKKLVLKLNLWKKKLLIIGVMQTSLLVLRSIKNNKTMGYEALGFLDDDSKKIGKKFLGVKVIGPISELENISKAYGSKDIMVATPHMSREEFRKLLSKCENISESLWLIPRAGDFITEGVEINKLGEIITLRIKRRLLKPWNIVTKSIFDLSLTIILIILFLPLLFISALAIKLDSKGPVFFAQKRLGKGKKQFKLLKFRSMFIDGHKYIAKYLETNPELIKEWEKYKKLKTYDPRVTRVGRIIRKNSIDELPQLFNVMLGKMSLVGPRPYLEEELEEEESFKNTLSKVKPGITGLWQISGRSELSFEKRIALDEFYIRNWSLWMDISILLRSIWVWLSRKGAY